MDEIDYKAANEKLLSAAVILSPTGKAQAGFSKLINQLRWDGKSEKEIGVSLLSAMQRGIMKGFWPY